MLQDRGLPNAFNLTQTLLNVTILPDEARSTQSASPSASCSAAHTLDSSNFRDSERVVHISIDHEQQAALFI